MPINIVNSASIRRAEQIEQAAFRKATDFICSNMGKYLQMDQMLCVALEKTVPHTVLFDAVSILEDRDPYKKPNGATELPYGYWTDLLVFPVRESNGLLEAMFDRKWYLCASIPLLTVERKVLGIIGEKRIVGYCELEKKLAESLIDVKKELSDNQRYVYEKLSIGRYSVACCILGGHETQIK